MSEFFNLEKLLTFFNYIFWFFMLNIFFSILNIPVILFFLFVGLSNITTYLPLFLVSLIPFGASFTALLYCMRKLVKYKDLDLFSDFLKGLKYNWKQSTLMWCGELFLIFLLSFNLRIFSTVYYIIIPYYTILTTIINVFFIILIIDTQNIQFKLFSIEKSSSLNSLLKDFLLSNHHLFRLLDRHRRLHHLYHLIFYFLFVVSYEYYFLLNRCLLKQIYLIYYS